jgi:hypothetical protein
MTGSLHAWSMGTGAVVALVPVARAAAVRGRARVVSGATVGHLGMAVSMAVLAVGSGRGWAALAALAAAAGSALVAAEIRCGEPGVVHCVIDLLATAWIVTGGCRMPGTAVVAPAAGHHQMTSGGSCLLLAWAPVLLWLGATVVAARAARNRGGDRGAARLAAGVSVVMALTMVPMVT